MVGLAFAVAASCNFPALFMSVFWKGATSRGVLIGGFLGLISAVTMVVLSPAVWTKTFGFKTALFPYDNPALFSMVCLLERAIEGADQQWFLFTPCENGPAPISLFSCTRR